MDLDAIQRFWLGCTYHICYIVSVHIMILCRQVRYILGGGLRAKKWPKGPFASNKTAKVNHCQTTDMAASYSYLSKVAQFFKSYPEQDLL